MRACSTFSDTNTIAGVLSDLSIALHRCSDCLIQQDLLGFEVTHFWCRNRWAFKSIVLEVSFLNSAIWKFHATYTILDASIPFAFVTGTVFPEHLSVPMALVILITAFVIVARLPSKESHTIFLVICVATLIHVAILVIVSLFPLAFTGFEPIFELSNVDATILPFVLALALWFSLIVRS